jgi:hypothetical protein
MNPSQAFEHIKKYMVNFSFKNMKKKIRQLRAGI